MSDHDFEKRVQQKMDELKFTPSDAVWKAVEKEIRKDRPRRRGWILIPILMIGLGVAGYLAFYRSPEISGVHADAGSPNTKADAGSQNTKATQAKTKTSTSNQDTAPTENNIASTGNGPAEERNTPTPSSPASGPEGQSPQTQSLGNGPDDIKSNPLRSKSAGASGVRANDVRANDVRANDVGANDVGANDVRANGIKGNEIKENAIKSNKGKYNEPGSIAGTPETDQQNRNKQNVAAEPEKTGRVGQRPLNQLAADILVAERAANGSSAVVVPPVIAGSAAGGSAGAGIKPNDKTEPSSSVSNQVAVNDPQKTDSAIVDKASADKQAKADSSITGAQTIIKSKKKKSPWEWGITVSGGISNTSDDPLTGVLKSSPTADALSASAPANGFVFAPGAAGLPPATPSKVKAGPYFSIGGFVNKQLSKTFAFSAGLQYSQYNTIIEVGYRVDSSRLVNNGSQVMNVARYYRADDNSKFSNRYHFIELPLSVQTRITGSKAIPVFWNAGINFSRLVASDALLFDSGTGVYYKDKSAYNKNQFGLSTGFTFGLFGKSKTPMLLGPSFKYNTSRMFSKDIAGDKHLMSAALDLRILLNKK